MTEPSPSTTPGTGYGLLIALAVVGLFGVAFLAGFKTHEGLAKADVDDFGRVKLQDHIYDVTLVRAPYEPETVTIAQLKAEAAERAALEGE